MPTDLILGQASTSANWGSTATWVLAGIGVLNLILLIWNLRAERLAKLSATLYNLVRSALATAKEAAELREQASNLREQADEARKEAEKERLRAIEAQDKAAQAELEAREAQARANNATARAERNEQELQTLRQLLRDAMALRSAKPPPPRPFADEAPF